MIRSMRFRWLQAFVVLGVVLPLDVFGMHDVSAISSQSTADPLAYIGISVSNDLHEQAAYAELDFGQMSSILNLSGNETYRVRVSATERDTVFGRMYLVELFQADGTPLDSMLAGVTATFHRYGVQVVLMPVIQSQAIARAAAAQTGPSGR